MYDAIVLGLGGVGSMALRGLARQGGGGNFLGIEAYAVSNALQNAVSNASHNAGGGVPHGLVHGRGSSHGKTRIYRQAYFEHPSYVPWIRESLAVFQQMQEEHQTSLLQECGTLLLEEASAASPCRDAFAARSDPSSLPPLCRASYESALAHGIPVEHLDASALLERFPQFRYTTSRNMVGLFEPGGGFVRCEQVQRAAQAEAQAASHVDILSETRALSFSYVPHGNHRNHGNEDAPAKEDRPTIELRVQNKGETEVQVLTTQCLLLSMGAWTGQLIPSWAPHLRATRQLQGWLPVDEENASLFGAEHMPTWVMVHPAYPLPLYGVPCDAGEPEEDHRRWLKVGIHGRDDLILDPSLNPRQVSQMEREETLQAVSLAIDPTRLRGSNAVDLQASSEETASAFADIIPCFYTMTRDTHFMIGTPAGHSGVFAVAGLSGHGYKQTPVLGQMMVDYALGNDMSKWKSEFCTPSRFGV
jgi:sarcosine oxidase